MKRIFTVLIAVLMVFSMASCENDIPEKPVAWNGTATEKSVLDTMIEEDGENYVIHITTAEDFAGIMENISRYGDGRHAALTIELDVSLDMGGHDWIPANLDGYNNACGLVTIDGNGHTIHDLTTNSKESAGLVGTTWAGESALTIKDLTLKDADIKGDTADETGSASVGAFIGNPSASHDIEIINCRLIDSKVEGGHWTGGLIGSADGYDKEGPVFENVLVKDTEISNVTVTGKGSVGGVVGHATKNPWTKFTIDGSVLTDVTVTSTGDSDKKAGSLIGTIGIAGDEAAGPDGTMKKGGVYVNNTEVTDASVKSNETVIDRIYGRKGSEGGRLYVDGEEVTLEF